MEASDGRDDSARTYTARLRYYLARLAEQSRQGRSQFRSCSVDDEADYLYRSRHLDWYGLYPDMHNAPTTSWVDSLPSFADAVARSQELASNYATSSSSSGGGGSGGGDDGGSFGGGDFDGGGGGGSEW